DTAPPGQRRHVGPGLQALRNQRGLFRGTPSPATRHPGNQLDPAILIAFAPVLMHGIMAGIIHRPTRATPKSRSFNKSRPPREGGPLASVTLSTRNPGPFSAG